MRKNWFSTFAASVLFAVTGIGSVTAADVGGGSLKDDHVEHQYRWGGIYIGGQAGIATGQTSGRVDIPGFPIAISTDYDMSGALYGGYAGFNYQMGRTVLGVEGTWSASEINGDTGCVVIFNCKRHVDSIATLVGRLGYAMDRTMIYGLAGFAWADVDTNVVGNIFGLLQLTGGETHTGWVAGMGIEHAISSNIVARIEYNHISFGSETHNLGASFAGVPLPGITIPTKVDLDLDTIKVGVGFKFN